MENKDIYSDYMRIRLYNTTVIIGCTYTDNRKFTDK